MSPRPTRAEPLRGRVGRLLLIGLVLLAAAGCASPSPAAAEQPERQIREIETLARARLEPVAEGLARQVRLVLTLAPLDPLELEVLGRRPADQQGHDGLLEVSVRWKDHLGVRPDSRGGSFRTTVPMGEDGLATREQPFERPWVLDLPDPAPGVLARSVSVVARLHPVDLRSERYRTAGVTVPFEGAGLASFAPAPEGDEAAALFLESVGAGQPEADPLERIAAAVAALPSTAGPSREALFGALHFLTGQTNGRSVGRWQAWWEQAREAGDPQLPAR